MRDFNDVLRHANDYVRLNRAGRAAIELHDLDTLNTISSWEVVNDYENINIIKKIAFNIF